MMNSKRLHKCHDESVYAAINGCSFIPGASYERLLKRVTLPAGIVRIFQSDNGYLRAVAFHGNRPSSNYAGLLVDKSGRVVHKQAKEDSHPLTLPSLAIILKQSTGVRVWDDPATINSKPIILI